MVLQIPAVSVQHSREIGSDHSGTSEHTHTALRKRWISQSLNDGVEFAFHSGTGRCHTGCKTVYVPCSFLPNPLAVPFQRYILPSFLLFLFPIGVTLTIRCQKLLTSSLPRQHKRSLATVETKTQLPQPPSLVAHARVC